MKNDVLSSWFKELCSLIFVQAFQAFLLAIIMSIIVKVLASSTSASIEGGIDAAGVLAIFALASLSKIELLVKNIFGLTSSYGDPSLASGRKSLVGSMLAVKGVGRVLDNGRKFLGGVGQSIAGGVRYAKAKHDLNDYQINQRLGNSAEGGNPEALTGGGYTRTPALGGGGAGGNAPGSITRLANEIQALNKTLNDQNNKAKKDDKLKELNAAIDAAKKDIKAGGQNALTGFSESVGALHGAVAGAVIGMADGGNVLENAAQGMGVGDVIGQKVSNVIVSTPKITNTVVSATKEIKRGYKNRDAYNKLKEELAKENSKSIKSLEDKLEMYAKQGSTSGSRMDSSKREIRTRKSNVDDI